jgi:hypothetical protein
LYTRVGSPRAGIDRWGKSRLYRDSIPVRTFRSESLYRQRYPGRFAAGSDRKQRSTPFRVLPRQSASHDADRLRLTAQCTAHTDIRYWCETAGKGEGTFRDG